MDRRFPNASGLKRRSLRDLLLLGLIAAGVACSRGKAAPPDPIEPPPPSWKAGVAAVAITPTEPMWMAGYAARNKPSEGKVHDLYAKALALEDASGVRLVIVTLDLIGITRSFREQVAGDLAKRYGLAPEALLINASHTHCGPEIRATKAELYGLAPDRVRQCEQYLDGLRAKLVDLVGQALDDLAPARLSYSRARAGFAMNRRLATEQGVLNRPNPDGPVDHDVPVLRVDAPDGQLRAVVFGYACHNTTLSFYEFCGDYAGFAQRYVEEEHRGAAALFLAGCGGDQNPQPRGRVDWARQKRPRKPTDDVPYQSPRDSLDHAQQHGRALANAVETALIAYPRVVDGPLRLALDEVALEFEPAPTREQLEQAAKSSNEHERRRAEVLLAELAREGRLAATYPYLVQVAQFGDDLTLVALAGEAVVDYSLRLKAEPAGAPVWVAAYSNDVFGYVPSRRVLEEGGYEARDAVLYYSALTGAFAPSVEKRIVEKVHALIRDVRREERKSRKPKAGAMEHGTTW